MRGRQQSFFRRLTGAARERFRRATFAVFMLFATPAAVAGQATSGAVSPLDARAAEAYREGTRAGFERAIELWSQAVAEHRRGGDRAAEAITLIAIGNLHRRLSRPDSALAYYALALPVVRAIGDRVHEARTLDNIGLAHTDLGRVDSALVYYASALSISRAAGDRAVENRALTNIGLAHNNLGRPDSALVYYALALSLARAVGDRGGEASTLGNIAGANYALGRPDSALAYYALALPVIRALGDPASEAVILGGVGVLHLDLGRPDSALAYHAQALPIQRTVGDRTGEAGTLSNIGLAHHSLGRADSALAYFALALPIVRAAGERTREATTLNNIGFAYRALGRPDSALTYFALALPIARAARNSSLAATTLMNVGTMHRDLRRPDSALTYYAQALPILRAAGNRRVEALTLNNIGSVYQYVGQPDSALAYYAEALPIQRSIGDRASEGLTLGNIGKIQQDIGGAARFRAVAYYDSAAAILASIADRAGGDQNRLSFGEQSVALFQHWALVWLDIASELDTRSPDRRAAIMAALAAAERGRAQAMLDLMRVSATDVARDVGARSATTRAGADLSEEGERLIQSVAVGGSASLSYVVSATELIVWLSLPDGEVLVFRGPLPDQELAAAIAALRAGMGADSAAVRGRMALRDAPLLEATRDLGGDLASGEGAAEAAQWLAAWLVPADLLARVPAGTELVIVPHGALNLVPFAALPIDTTGELLGIRYALRYSPSLSTLVEIAAQGSGIDAAGARARALVIGDPAMPEVRSHTGAAVRLGQLAGAKAEGRWVAEQTGVHSLTEGDATESKIRELLPRATLVHFATHGYAYGTEALARRSFIALASGGAHDGLLTVGEVLDEIPSLSAELVVLSACQTGLGQLRQAEGTVGLQRAFLARGARSVLVSLWSVSDRATDLLMRSFYSHWLAGKPKAEALRRAQEEVRAIPEFADPRYWAAFQLVGAR